MLETGAVPTLGLPADDWTREHCPLLWQMLTVEVLRDKTLRVLPSLLIERARGGYRVTLQDHASRQQASAEAEDLGALWQALEAVLRGPKPFRPYKSKRVQDVERRKALKKAPGQK